MGQGHSCGTARTRAACFTLALAGTALALSGCQDVRNALGFDKSPPDEFRIVSRAPLSLPPDYSLRPPQPGAPRPQEQTQYERARQAVIGGASPAGGGAAGGSPGQAAFLARSGADRADPAIRDTVNREAGQAAETDETLLERLIFGRQPAEPLVDPTRESQRLREAQATGRAPNESETPTIQRRRRSLLEGLF
ncbi:MAG: DUF3035 domain-containing protein [Alphaproteobacteria bacterium]|nr:DUF3035 domain-containing protein [Alphaproteobacteria bacterium]